MQGFPRPARAAVPRFFWIFAGRFFLFAHQSRSAIRAGAVDTALPDDVRDFLPALRTNAIPARSGSGFVAAAAAAPAALAGAASPTASAALALAAPSAAGL